MTVTSAAVCYEVSGEVATLTMDQPHNRSPSPSAGRRAG